MNLLLAMVLLAAPGAAPVPERHPAEAELIRALSSDDLPALRRRYPNLVLDDGGLKSVLERYDCITVAGTRIMGATPEGTNVRLLVEVAADGMTAGPIVVPESLPASWSVLADAETGELRGIDVEENRVGRLLATAPPEEVERVVEARTDLDPDRLLGAIADHAWRLRAAGAPAMNVAVRRCAAICDVATRVSVLHARTSGAALLGNLDEARATAAEALRLARESGEPQAIAVALFATGVAAWWSGAADEAVEWFDQSFALIDQLRDPRIALKAGHMASFLELDRGRFSRVAARAARTREYARRTGWRDGVDNAAFIMSAVQHRLRNYDIALEIDRELVRSARDAGDKERLALALHNIGETELLRGRPGEAIAYIKEAQSLLLHLSGARLLNLARAYRAVPDLEKAEATAREAAAAAKDDYTVLPRAYDLLAQLMLERGDAAAAEQLARDAIAFTEASGGTSRETHLHGYTEPRVTRAAALRRLGRGAEALATLQEAVAIEEEVDLDAPDASAIALSLEGRHAAHRALADALLAGGSAREALQVAAWIKARALQATLARPKVDRSEYLTAEEMAEEERLTREVSALSRRLVKVLGSAGEAEVRAEADASRLRLQRYRSELNLRYPQLVVRRASAQTLDAERLQSVLLENSALLLDFIATRTNVHVIVVESQPLRVWSYTIDATSEELSREIDGLVASLSSRDLRYRTRTSRLYDLVLRPAEEALRRHRTLCVAPDGPVWRLPFHVLTDRRQRFVAEAMPVFYVPSSWTLTTQRDKPARQESASILAVANPDIEGASTLPSLQRVTPAPLPHAESEARSILRLYGAGTVLAGADALEDRVKRELARYRVLHFATHGLVDDLRPMHSSLLLSPSADHEDGILEAREIVDLHLQADMAVLSACETARGRVAGGEGTLGLAWAFMVAGCPRAVASLWKIDSASTKELMVAFHRRVRAGASPAQALREAQLSVRKQPEYRHPYYWAAFIVIGDGAVPLF